MSGAAKAAHAKANQRADALAPAPPRHLSLGRWWRVLLNRNSKLGIGALAVGLASCIPFAPTWDLGWQLDFRQKAETTGEITKVTDSRVRVNDQSVSLVEYEFWVDGKPYSGRAHGMGASVSVNASVPVLYVVGSPQVSSLPGAGVGTGTFILIIPGVGLLLLLRGLWGGVTAGRLLSAGIVTRGQLLRKEETRAEVNEQPVYKLVFGFTDQGGARREVTERSHRPKMLTDDAFEKIIYLPHSPTQAKVLDALVVTPVFHADGTVDVEEGGVGLILLPLGLVGTLIALLLAL